MPIRIQSFDLHRFNVRLRMPFRYGIATMTEGPVIFLRVRAEMDGRSCAGLASDLLPPKWFTKVPGRPLAEEIAEMLRVIRRAAEAVLDLEGESCFEVWRRLYAAQSQWGAAEKLPSLLVHFGTSLVERALIEAATRARGRAFGVALRDGTLGFQPEEIHPELRGTSSSAWLPAAPLERLTLRHTVGLSDPLTDAAIAEADRLDDGLPQSLAAGIRAYGLRHFKLKVNGDLPRDLERLAGIAAVLREHAPPDCAFSLDGNEQFTTVDAFRQWWEACAARTDLREFFRHLLFVEQPLHRDMALQPEVGAAFAAWPERPPIIIDESDGALGDLPRALELGYAGTSHKNCKGVFKGAAHRCLLAARQQAQPARRLLMSGEDLCNIGPVSLPQDLAVMAALGIGSVERNGHHYHAGLSQFPRAVQDAMLLHHGDLYTRSRDGWATLRVVDGQLDLASVNRAPFGVGFVLDAGQFERVAGNVEEMPS